MFRSVLIPIDFFASSQRVAERAALLPLTEGARLTLLHVVPKLLPREAQRRAESDAQEALSEAKERLARALPPTVKVKTAVTSGTAALEIAKQAKSLRTELIVMGRVGARAVRDLFIGSTAERVVRQAQCPVLVVRLPAHHGYQRPALALDLDEAAPAALAFALRMLPAPPPPMLLVHAYDAPFHGLIYPSLAPDEAKEYRRYYKQKAAHGFARLLAAQRAGGLPNAEGARWVLKVQYGSPRALIPKAVAKHRADLLVLGTHGRSGVAQAFLGTVAGDVLRDVPCDVLVVPPRRGRPR